ncbi:MAG TPA: hypothetical protein DHV96_01295 [Lachnospiraceae bacterium]|nr:hypothetical protein [Lachnospiraceae bacterium]
MRKRMSTFMYKHGAKLCNLAIALATVTVSVCRGMYYQPKEPDGFAEFALNHTKNSK